MAIEFDCPHCKTHYRLKDEFGGKTATCKNPDCRKVIPIPKPTGPVMSATPADLDAIAAAAFAEEAAKANKPTEEMIPVTCSGCDHTWSVEASKEGKNVRCPECGKVIRVPIRKKDEKADWRTGGGGPSLAKRDTGLEREGAFGTADTRGISEGTAREIVKGREAEEEPEERRKRRLKWGVRIVAGLAVVGAGVYFALKTGREIKSDANMAQAVKEQKDQGSKDARFEALIHRASAEYRARTAGSADEAKGALEDWKLARNKFRGSGAGPKGQPADAAGVLADVAVTIPYFLATDEQAERGFKKDVMVKELRQTLQEISDLELVADIVRTVTREFARRGQPTLGEDVAHQRGESNELVAQIGLELLRINREQYKPTVEAMLKKVGNADTPGLQALRAFFPPSAKKEGEAPPAPSLAATAEAEAIKGNIAAATSAVRKVGKVEDKAKALAIVGQTILETSPGEATPLLVDASKALKDVKGLVSPWVSVRVCRLLARVGQFDEAESLAASLSDNEAKAWGRLEALRGRLEGMKGQKADDGWLGPIGDPSKSAAAAKAHEVIARYNAAQGFGDYQGVVKKWPIGTVRPFGTAGLVLGQLDRDGK
jgi:ribosomal protein S27E